MAKKNGWWLTLEESMAIFLSENNDTETLPTETFSTEPSTTTETLTEETGDSTTEEEETAEDEDGILTTTITKIIKTPKGTITVVTKEKTSKSAAEEANKVKAVKKSLSLTGFDARTGTLSNGKTIQAGVSGRGLHRTSEGSLVDRGYATDFPHPTLNKESNEAACACLDLILRSVFMRFPSTSRSAPSKTVHVSLAAKKTSLSGSSYPKSFTSQKWRLIVKVAKLFEKSLILNNYVDNNEYTEAVRFLYSEIHSEFIAAGLVPADTDIAQGTSSEESASTTQSGLPVSYSVG